jgi:hypothetical protein
VSFLPLHLQMQVAHLTNRPLYKKNTYNPNLLLPFPPTSPPSQNASRSAGPTPSIPPAASLDAGRRRGCGCGGRVGRRPPALPSTQLPSAGTTAGRRQVGGAGATAVGAGRGGGDDPWPDRAPVTCCEATAVAARAAWRTWELTVGRWGLRGIAVGIRRHMKRQVPEARPSVSRSPTPSACAWSPCCVFCFLCFISGPERSLALKSE